MSDSTVTIRITRTDVVTKARREWKESAGETPDRYGYVDDVWPQPVETLVLQQTLPADTFNLSAVIKAVNGL